MDPLAVKNIFHISVSLLYRKNEYPQPSELLMCCDITIYSNSCKKAKRIRPDTLPSGCLEPVYRVFYLLAAFGGPPAAWRKYILFKRHVSQFRSQSLVYYREPSRRTLSLMNSKGWKNKKNVCTRYVFRLHRRCTTSLLLSAICCMRVPMCVGGVDENLISQSELTSVLLTLFYLFMLSHARWIHMLSPAIGL